jgi:hypothetical protein
MFSRAWLVLCGVTTIAAQQHIADSPFLNQWIIDSGYVSISTAGSVRKCHEDGKVMNILNID